MNQIKKLCVFISHIYGDFQRKLCEGIVNQAQISGYSIDIFTSNDGEELGDYGLGEGSILRIPRPEQYAGVIYASGTYLSAKLKSDIKEYILTKFSCPIVDISQEDSSFSRICLDNYKPLVALVEHLIKVHHYKTIYYLGSSLDEISNRKKYLHYTQTMEQYALSLPPSENSSFFCDYTPQGICQAFEHFFSGNTKPEAIVCYDDRLAFMLIAECQKRNLHVPKDIAITGCDTLEYGQKTKPILSSVTFPIEEMGEKAVSQIIHQLHGEPMPSMTRIDSTISIGTSCGCKEALSPLPQNYSYQLYSQIQSLEKNIIHNMHMNANFQGVSDIDSGMNLLEQFVQKLPGCKELYLCLYENWNELSEHIREITSTEEEVPDSDSILLKLAIKDGQRLPECTFSKRSVLPAYLCESDAYIFAPLFFEKKAFGYIALSNYNHEYSYSFPFISWLMNVNCMLKSLCDTQDRNLLIGRLETLYTKDELTGLNNQQGFRIAAEPLIKQANSLSQNTMVISCALENSDTIFHQYGTEEYHFALQVLAHALEHSAPSDVVCARFEENKFYMLAIDFSKEQAAALIEKVHKYLSNYNKLNTKPYSIQASTSQFIKQIKSLHEIDKLL